MKSCSWFIIIQRLAIDLVFIMLVNTTIHVIAMTTDVIVLLRALTISDVVCELFELCEVVVFEISHIPDVRT